MTFDDWIKTDCPEHLRPQSSHESRQMRAAWSGARITMLMDDIATEDDINDIRDVRDTFGGWTDCDSQVKP